MSKGCHISNECILHTDNKRLLVYWTPLKDYDRIFNQNAKIGLISNHIYII